MEPLSAVSPPQVGGEAGVGAAAAEHDVADVHARALVEHVAGIVDHGERRVGGHVDDDVHTGARSGEHAQLEAEAEAGVLAASAAAPSSEMVTSSVESGAVTTSTEAPAAWPGSPSTRTTALSVSPFSVASTTVLPARKFRYERASIWMPVSKEAATSPAISSRVARFW